MTYSKFYFEEFIRIRNRLSLIKDRNSIRVFQDGAVAVEGQRTDYDSISRINVRFADASRDAEKLERFAVERRRFREKLGSKLDFTRNTDRKSFSFFAGQPCNQRAHPSRIDRPRERWNEDKTRRKCKMFRFDYITASVLYGTRWPIFFFEQSSPLNKFD